MQNSELDRPDYGTVEYYEQYFSDVLADVGDGYDPQVGLRVMEGFQKAIGSWLKYHQDSARNYEQLHSIFLSNISTV
tara:strand:- start:174 stop:404 length:231 start_codon:yes stop_codon:yes gene_type:complete